MPVSRLNQSLMKPFVVLAIPGMYLVYKYNQFKRQQQENSRRRTAEKELAHLNQKIVSTVSCGFSALVWWQGPVYPQASGGYS